MKLPDGTKSCGGLVPASPALVDHIQLDTTRVVAGNAVKGTLVVTNKTQEGINLNHSNRGCRPQFAIVLTSNSFDPEVGFTLPCFGRPLVIRPGTNRFPITVVATYSHCSATSKPACIGTSGMPPIPPGRYVAALIGGDDVLALPPPQPVPVTVVSQPTKRFPVVDLSATPRGWVPVAFREAQVSVPATWYVLYDSPPCPVAVSAPGEIFVNPPPGVFHCPSEHGPGIETIVKLLPTSKGSPPSGSGRPFKINGIVVIPIGPQTVFHIDLLVPSAGVRLAASGVLANRVVHTLTWSPRAVVLAKGSAPGVPSSWRTQSFFGITFSFPAAWPTLRTTYFVPLGGWCSAGAVFRLTEVLVSTDQHFVPAECPVRLAQPVEPPISGLQLEHGPFQPRVSVQSTHCLHLHGLTACPATNLAYPYSILVLRVTVPKLKPVIVSIGLAGSGIVARTILDSLRPAV